MLFFVPEGLGESQHKKASQTAISDWQNICKRLSTPHHIRVSFGMVKVK